MAHAQGPINVTVDGDVVAFGAQRPVEQFGTVLVPLRGVFEKLGATVAYDGGTKSILAVRGATNVSLKLGSREAQVDGATRTLSVPAQAINGTTLVPLRFVSESLGAQVNWQPTSRTVIVTTTGGATGGTGDAPTTTPTTPANGRPGATGSRYTYGRVAFDYELNNFTLPDKATIEAQIRRNLDAENSARVLRQRPGSPGIINVNISFERVNQTDVRTTVRLNLDPEGRGESGIAATESATTLSRDKRIDAPAVLQAFRRARRTLLASLNQGGGRVRRNQTEQGDQPDQP